MKTIKINLYSFDELSEDAKQKAKDNFQFDDFWESDRTHSMQKAKELYSMLDGDAGELSGVRLYKYIVNNILPELRRPIKYTTNGIKYPSDKIYKDEKARFSKIQFSEEASNLTGYCDDYEFLDPLLEFLKEPLNSVTGEELANTNLHSIWSKLANEEYESFYEDENFQELCEANEYTFEEDGTMRNFYHDFKTLKK